LFAVQRVRRGYDQGVKRHREKAVGSEKCFEAEFLADEARTFPEGR